MTKLVRTDSLFIDVGVSIEKGLTEDNRGIGDNSSGFLLLESGDRILQEDGSSRFQQEDFVI